MLSYLLLFVLVCHIVVYYRFYNKGFFESVIFGLVTFLGINSLYFFIASVLNFSLSLFWLLITNIVYCFISYLANKKESNLSKDRNKNYELLIIIVAFLTIILFFSNFRTFNDGLRIPVPSFTEDSAQHLNFVLKPLFKNEFVDITYPFAFHGNAWLLIELSTQIFKVNNDFILITNVFSAYIWLIIFLSISFLSILILDLVSFVIKKRFLFCQIVIPFVTFFFGSIVTFYFVEYGFFSNWLNQLFSLSIIYLLSREENKLASFVLFIPLLFGFFFSYSFFIPVLAVFFGYLFFSERNKVYLYLSLISIFLSVFFFVELLFFSEGIKFYLVVPGGFPLYPKLNMLMYILFSFVYYLLIKNDKSKLLGYLSCLAMFFLLYSFTIALFQYLVSGHLSYSFHKAFASSFLLYGMFATSGLSILIIKFFVGAKNRSFILNIFIKLMVVALSLIMIIFNYIHVDVKKINPPLSDVFAGKGNFFLNDREKFNSVIYAIDNFPDYENVIYIDGDYQSTRWATLSYLPTHFNVVYDLSDPLNCKNYDFYNSKINTIDSKVLILSPNRLLEVDCNAITLIKSSIKMRDKVLLYPFDLDNFNRNCHTNLK